MRAHRRHRAIGVAGGDQVHDLIMVLKRDLFLARPVQQHPVILEQPPQHGLGWSPSGSDSRKSAQCGALFADEFAKIAHVLRRGVFGSDPHQPAFEHPPRLLQMLKLFGFRGQQHPRHVVP
nr:hypothetical protein [Paracoccus haematequi]